MGIEPYYKQLIAAAVDIQKTTFSDSDTLGAHTHSHGYLHDYSIVLDFIRKRYEAPVFDLALREYQFALLALSTGQYRQAFISLRLFFEMSLATYLFSTNELSYRLWKINSKDINWQELVDPDKGIFSKIYCKAFNDALVEHVKPYSSIAQNVYRECSEYVHGNSHTHTRLSHQIEFSKAVCLEWHDKAKSMHVVLLFLFCIRYLPYIDFTDNARLTSLKTKLEAMILSELGHIAEIRSTF